MRRSQRGLTLVEVLVALVFTGIAFTALALSQVTGFRVTRTSEEVAIAKDIAMRRLELIRSYGFEPYNLCPTFDPAERDLVGYPPCSGSETSADYPSFEVDWEITNNPAGTPVLSRPALVEVRVTVSWPDGEGGRDEFPLTSYLSCGDPGEGATTNVPCPQESLWSS